MSNRIKRFIKLLAVALGFVALTGCSTITQYSVDSYQGPLRLQDQGYVQAHYSEP